MTPARIARAQGPFLEKTAQQPQGGALPPEADTEAEAYWSMEQLRGGAPCSPKRRRMKPRQGRLHPARRTCSTEGDAGAGADGGIRSSG